MALSDLMNMNKQKNICGVYKITSPIGLVYIGSTNNIHRRVIEHKYRSKLSELPLYKSYREYGVNNHIVDIIHDLPLDIDKSIMDTYELFYYNKYKECGIGMLNCRDAGVRGKLHSEHKNKIRNSLKGKHCGNENPRFGVKHTDEVKYLISQSKIGKPSPNLGKKLSDETKRKMRESALLRYSKLKNNVK